MPETFPPLKNEPVIFAHGMRIYSVFCGVCGKSEASESEALHELICSDCGQNVFRFIRDPGMEKLMTMGPGGPNA